MNLLGDEGVDRQIVEQLRNNGHAVLYIAEMEPGVSDEIILGRANAQHALLITADKDFGELVFRQHLVHAGVVLVRLAGLLPTTKAQIVGHVLQSHDTELLDAFSVISPGNVRIRKRKP
jgi:predicted nuclease of predicted toxin-antitoxin system